MPVASPAPEMAETPLPPTLATGYLAFARPFSAAAYLWPSPPPRGRLVPVPGVAVFGAGNAGSIMPAPSAGTAEGSTNCPAMPRRP